MLGLTQNSHVGYLRLSTLLLLAWVVFSPSSTLFAAVETVAVSADNDDAEQLLNNGNMRLNSGALNIVGVNAVPQLLGIVFRNVNVDDTATICSAYIQFQARGVNPGTNPFDYDPANYTITAEAAGNPTAPIQNTNSYLSGLTKTTASVNWQPPEWLVNNQRGVDQRTADLTFIVNELIGTHGFTQNDNMLFLIEGQGSRLADSRNAGAAIGPELFIDYDSGAGCGSPTTVNTQVSNNNDDAEENLVSGAMTRGGNRLEIGTRNGGGNNKQIVGIRFQNVNVPRFAIINSADIDFTVRVTTPTPSTATVVRIFGEDIDNSAQFTAANSNISGRTPTTALVDWTPATTWTNDDIETTPDIANIVQEIVNRGNWNANNAMTFFIVGTGERRASSHNQSVAEAAVLNINYTAAGVTASLALAMDDDPTGPAAGQAHAIPGATVEYTLTVTNETTVNLDSGATVVCYDVPANTQILMDGYTGTPDMPIDLANNTSGLSFTYGGPSDGTDSLVFYDDVDCAAGTGSAVTPNASTGTASNVGSVEITFNGSFTASDTVTDPAVDVLMKVIID